MRYLSVCSGIEAATVAWHPLGWTPAAFSEIEAFPRAVLSHHYPDVPLHGDFTTIGADDYGPIDLLVGGTPCQSFSVAGLRGGMADERGNLALEYLRLADRTRPRWLVWENVPGVLSSNGGRDFGTFLGGLAELGYGFAYRVLDAQYFGVPQRRRRVFVIGCLGDWRRAAAVLFERHSLSGDTPPRRKKGQDASDRIGFSTVGSLSGGYGSKLGTDESCQGSVIPAIAHSLRAEGFDAGGDGTGRGTPLVPVAIQSVNTPCEKNQNGIGVSESGQMYSLTARDQHAVCFTAKDDPLVPVAFDMRGREGGAQMEGPHDTANIRAASGGSSKSYIAFGWQASPSQSLNPDEITPSLDKSKTVAVMENQRAELRLSEQTDALSTGGGKPGQGYPAALQGSAVRRLTPRECERLMGLPDDYTAVPYRGKPAADGPRYKALGNSMAVPCMVWLGQRIQMVEAIQSEAA